MPQSRKTHVSRERYDRPSLSDAFVCCYVRGYDKLDLRRLAGRPRGARGAQLGNAGPGGSASIRPKPMLHALDLVSQHTLLEPPFTRRAGSCQMIGDTLLGNRIIERRTVPVVVYPRASTSRHKALGNWAGKDHLCALRQLDRPCFCRD
jgi:hypothetical protein